MRSIRSIVEEELHIAVRAPIVRAEGVPTAPFLGGCRGISGSEVAVIRWRSATALSPPPYTCRGTLWVYVDLAEYNQSGMII